jgi:tetratricopeptide (TPR) repeat protein
MAQVAEEATMKRVFQILVVSLFLVLMFAFVATAAEWGDSYKAGLQALKSGDGHKAVTLLSKAIDAHPRDFRYYNDRGVAYRMMGDLEKAIADYSRAIELKPDYTNALNNRGVVHLQQALYDRAIKDFSEALKYGGLESKIYTNLGAAYAAKGDHRNAIKYFDAAISLRPMDYRAFIFMGETLEKMGDKERALKMYRLGLGLIPDTALFNRLESRVAGIEKALISARQKGGKAGKILPQATDQSGPQKSGSGQAAKLEAGRTRKITLARPIPPSVPEALKPSVLPVEIQIETLEDLERRARTRVMGKITRASAEILRQGHEFLEKDDPTKALIRFEDTLQLERRKRNDRGVAWSSFEIGKVYSKLGDQGKAVSYFDAALRIFRKLKVPEETILTVIELAGSKAKAGQKDQAAAFYSVAEKMATTAGHPTLSKAIANLAAGKTHGQQKSAAAKAKQIKAQQRTASVVDQTVKSHGQTSHRAKPVTAGQSPVPRSKQTVVAPNNVAKEKEQSKSVSTRGQQARSEQPGSARVGGPHPEIARYPAPAGIFRSKAPSASSISEPRARGSRVKETSLENRIRDDLARLKKLRASRDEASMIPLLETLSGNYIQRKDYRKASYCLTASLALQDKLGFYKGRQRVFQQSGLLKERLGDPAGALEDLTRAIAASNDKSSAKTIKALEARARNIAKRLKVDAAALLSGFKILWKARMAGDDQMETEALYAIGRLYDKSEKPAEALNYYERSSASMLVDKGRMHQKMGNTKLAQEAYSKALEVFRKLDYSRYVSLVKKIRSPRVFSKQ